MHGLWTYAPGICVGLACLAYSGVAACAETGPPLPATDGEALIPAQEWSAKPGPRQVRVHIKYPGGVLSHVGPATGLMLSLHNWGGTGSDGAPDPAQLANRYDVVAVSVDYLQSGPWDPAAGVPYDFGYLQALDALRALDFVYAGLDRLGKSFARGRIYATGGSGGGNVSLMANKLAPRTFACTIDLCGMVKLSDDVAYGLPGRTTLNAGYSRDPANTQYLSKDDQEVRFVGQPDHLRTMKQLGNADKVIVVHGVADQSCPVEEAREMAANMQAAGLDVEAHFISDADLDGKALTSAGHPLGDRTLIVFKFADQYLLPGSPKALVRSGRTDFDYRDERVRFRTPNGTYVVSYQQGYPVGRFEPD